MNTKHKYDNRQIAYDIESTALNKSFLAISLNAALDLPYLSADDKIIIGMWLNGTNDRLEAGGMFALLDITEKIRRIG